MESEFVVIVSTVVLFGLLLFEVPVALSLLGAGGLGVYLLGGMRPLDGAFGAAPFTSTNSISMAVIPLFILMGALAVHGRIAEQVFSVARHHLRNLPGGIGLATIAGCAGFAAVSGSSVATAATFARMSISQMTDSGYPKHLAAGIVATSGTLGVLIPPSVLLVFYGILSGESIGKLLIAGIIPGLISAAAIAAYVFLAARSIDGRNRARKIQSPDEGLTDISKDPLPYRGLGRVIILFLIVVGGIYTGVFTSSEAAGIGALAACFFMVIELRHEGRSVVLAKSSAAVREAVSTSAMIFLIVIGASVFSFMLVLSGLPEAFISWATDLAVPAWLIVGCILLICIPLGMALDSFSIMAIMVPLTYPVVTGLGYDGIWYGILIVKMCELGLITPPVGVNAFVVAGAADDVPVEVVFRGIVPFAFVDLVVIALLFALPVIALWLPARMI